MNTWLLILYLSKGYGQYDIMFQEFNKEKSCLHALQAIQSIKQTDTTGICVEK